MMFSAGILIHEFASKVVGWFILWAMKPVTQNMTEKRQSELLQGEFKARRLP
jgi:hypothetical protein